MSERRGKNKEAGHKVRTHSPHADKCDKYDIASKPPSRTDHRTRQGKARQGFTITYCRGFTYGSVRDVIDDCAIIAVTLRVYRFSVAKFVKARRPLKFQSSSSKLT